MLVGLHEPAAEVSVGFDIFPGKQPVIARDNAAKGESSVFGADGGAIVIHPRPVNAFRNQCDLGAEEERIVGVIDSAGDLSSIRAQLNGEFNGRSVVVDGEGLLRSVYSPRNDTLYVK